MLKKVLLASALSVALLGSAQAADTAAATKAAQSPTIAVINLPFIMNEIPQSKALEQTLAKEFGPREQELQKMQQQGSQLGADLQAGKFKGDELTKKQREMAQLQSDFQLKARALQEDKQKRIGQEERKIAVEVQKAIDAIAKERKIDLVLSGSLLPGQPIVVYAEPQLDLSDEVIARVSGKKAK